MVKGKKLNFIASMIRRSKWQMAAISFLIVLAAALINIILFLASDYQQSFFREKERLNGEDIDILLMTVAPGVDCFKLLDDTLSGIAQIKQYEIDRVVTAPGSVEYKDSVLSNNISFMSFDAAMEKRIGRYELLESDHTDGVYLSYVFKSDCGYKTGQSITVKLGAENYTFRIAGFYNNVDTGTANCTDIVVLLSDEAFLSAASERGLSCRISLQMNEPGKADVLEADIARKVAEDCRELTFLGSSNYKKLSNLRYVTATIFKAVVSVSAVLMLAVILATIAITLTNYVRSSIRDLGTLKALGYRSRDLTSPVVGAFSGIAFAASLIGVALSYAVLPILKTSLEKQVGIPYTIHFMFAQSLLTVVICVTVSALSSYLSVLKIRRIYPINAIRENRSDKSAGHNYYSLDRTRLGLNTVLALKCLSADKLHGGILLVSMAAVAFLLGFSAFTYQNVLLDQNAILDLVCGQRTDSVLSVSRDLEDRLISELDNNTSVERYYLYSAFPITPLNLPKLYSYVIDEAFTAKEQLCIEGHLPETEKEIAVNRNYADRFGLALGDRLSFETETGTAGFVICGMVQGAFYSGLDCFLTYDGYSGISELPYASYYVDLKEDVDIDKFNTGISEKCPLISSTNYGKSIEGISSSYVRILILATVVVVILSFTVAAFILYVLISVLLANKNREHGILKALGFVTKDIVFQTVLCNMPPCVFGTVLGLLLSRNGAARLLAYALNGIGIFSFGTPTRYIYLFVSGLSVILFTVLVSIGMSGSVRKITPHQLFNRE